MRRLLPLLVALLTVPASKAQQWEAIHANLGITGTVGTDYLINVTSYDGTYLYANVVHASQVRVRLFRSADQGSTWTELPAYAAAGGGTAQLMTTLNGRLYAPQSNGGAMLYSDNQGQTWTSVAGAAMQGATTMARVGTTVVVSRGIASLIRRSTDGGATWADGTTLMGPVGGNGAVFIGIGSGSQLVRSTDGVTWTTVSVPGTLVFTSLWNVGTTLYAKAFVGGVVTSTDNGVTWTSVATASTPTFSYVFSNPSGSAWLVIDAPVQGVTVAYTRDRGATITNVSATYPKVTGSTLCTSNFTATADYAIGNAWQCSLTTTGGVGLYRLRLTAGVSNEPDTQAPAVALTLLPNPVAGRLSVQVRDVPAGPGRLAVYDARGRQVAVLHDGPVSGRLDAALDVSDLAAGVYLVRLTSNGTVLTRPVVVR
ncbi:MAG TPA: T9SS type A sorting domain-containing protein [Rhodothermales bacterium]|nr:T9SS type A sorting domain-containing protein [Rhodothermales bacterium]